MYSFRFLAGTECFPKLLVLNRVDILQAVQRFGNKSSRDKHLAESAEDEDVSTLQRKRNKAQKVGILVPVFGQALAGSDAPILPQGFNLKRVSREVDPPRPKKKKKKQRMQCGLKQRRRSVEAVTLAFLMVACTLVR